ncbi:MAG: hypoxanthine phosphoribosyltransferase [Deltaproteobacteria bacterium]|nr:hypoxanthine phosphoribosyltransferase [Deltaproteobacteria bacterium]
METMNPKVLISEEAIRSRVFELAAEISRDFAGRELTVVGVLNGSFVFMADLVRAIDLPLRCDFLGLSSYGSATESSGVVAITKDLAVPIEGRDILVVEDIVDTGLTLAYLQENLSTRHPRSVKVATLLSKPDRRKVEVSVDYLGFTIEDRFVVGYGLDFDGIFRNLRYIGLME